MQSFLGMLNAFADKVASYVSIPNISISTVDIIEILIISVLFYHVLVWIKDTRAWNLFKGIVIILIFVLIAAFFQLKKTPSTLVFLQLLLSFSQSLGMHLRISEAKKSLATCLQ